MITVKENDNEISYYLDNKLHRLNGPARIFLKGRHRKEWWVEGKLHRMNGPAIEYSNGSKLWYQNGKLHRLDGPAMEGIKGSAPFLFSEGVHNYIDLVYMGDNSPCFKNGLKRWYINSNLLSNDQIKLHQTNRLQSITISLSPLALPPYIILWILEWSESAYIFELNPRSVIKMIEGIRNSREKTKEY